MSDYSLLDDNKLVALCKKDDAQAFSVLTGRYFPRAVYYASRFCNPFAEKEDLAQEGMIGFISAVYAYDENQGASFSTFANHCIKNRIISAVRVSGSKKQIPSELLLPLDEQLNSPSEDVSPEDALISAEEAKRIYSMVNLSLTEKEKKVFMLFLSGMSYEQIAQATACTVKSVDGTLQRIRKKLREKLS